MAKLKITQIKSGIGGKRNQRETLKTLGLNHPHASVVREDSPSVRGLLNVVRHLVKTEEVD
ncbi:50S ribosomal protein L30 [Brevibacterium sp. 50QC2O2]|jgi:large subunit ribosomal protein L30|uniref:50S ribosomal protein L30 n=1 Tax=Brevibacterium TaxID=1696 RepID=UPI00211CAD20|nr:MULTISPECIES: 50S ribosomal protein L30 [unclassified Brevibacterium]MCQ9369188.1 50S ribosomal protein L30 [Brevibacterium sp. 91QC2O2]MCQ9385822.1 50S ribosomal protein L30 [Brevibacterium sp. 68QC2CO]MCQ9389401.1 50S ribosomal protein L30 [Brevibacterium sp. 50QC2O2]